MSHRFGNKDPNHSKKAQPLQTRLKPGQTGRLASRDTNRQALESMPISNTARRTAYDKIKKIETTQKEKGLTLDYEQLLNEVIYILKDDVDISFVTYFPQAKTQIGKAILSDGNFMVVFAKIMKRCSFIWKEFYFPSLRNQIRDQITQNRTCFERYFNQIDQEIRKEEEVKRQAWIAKNEERLRKLDQMKKSTKKKLQRPEQALIRTQENHPAYAPNKNPEDQIQEHYKGEETKQQPLQNNQIDQSEEQKNFRQTATMTSEQKMSRKSILKPSRLSPKSKAKSVRWSQISDCSESSYIKQIIQENKEYAYKQKQQQLERQRQQRIKKIRSTQSFLIDFFEINEVYEQDDVEIVGVVDEIDQKYAIMTVKTKLASPEPSYVKTRSTYELEKERQIAQKSRKQIIVIGLMKKLQTHQHDLNKLKEIEKRYPNIWAYVELKDPETFFMGSLPEDSVDGGSEKKEKI